jgi:putative phosphoribosyl transferase
MHLPIPDREAAGQALAKALEDCRDQGRVVVLALPRGGVPVAWKVAQHLKAEMDLIVVRKLGLPHQKELAMGAIASGGAAILNDYVLTRAGVRKEVLDEVTRGEQKELERRETAYRGDRPWPELSDATVILVDDGLATGATMRAAAQAVSHYHPKSVVVAVPVAPSETITLLESEVDRVVCLATPHPFGGIGLWYDDFAQVSDDEVRALLKQAWQS